MTDEIKNVRRELVGHVGVDRARIMICDPSYIQEQRLAERDLEMEDSQLKGLMEAQTPEDMTAGMEAYPLHYQIPYLLGHEGAAVVVRSGLGDGNYPVYATIAEVAQWGERVVRVEIDFLDHPFLATVPLELPDAMGKLLQELQVWLKERVETGGPGYGADGFLKRINTIMESYEGRD